LYLNYDYKLLIIFSTNLGNIGGDGRIDCC
jgi:hypothetical protein